MSSQKGKDMQTAGAGNSLSCSTELQRRARIFSIAVLAGIAFYWGWMLVTRSAGIDGYFVTDHNNTGMDYFNMLATLSDRNPYSDSANYPAFCFLIWRVMFHFLQDPDFPQYADGYVLRSEMIAQIGYIMFTMVCILLIWEALRYLAKGDMLTKILFCASIVLSGPMIFLLERGNILILALGLLLLFLILYDSPKAWQRWIGYVCLAMAASIKIYPAAFGLLVLQKKRYKETAGLAVLGAGFFFLPFFCFNGVDSIKTMLEGIRITSAFELGLGNNFSLGNLVKIVAAACGVYLSQVPSLVSVFCVVFCLLLFYIADQEWKRLFALALLCLWLPGFSYTYTLILFLLPIASFLFRCEKQGRFDKIYLLLFAMLMIPWGLSNADRINDVVEVVVREKTPDFKALKFPLSWGMVLLNLVILAFVALLLLDYILQKRNVRKIKGE